MRLLFLGTGPAEAIPRQGHTDALCMDARRSSSKSKRRRSAAIIETNGVRALIDAGPDIEEQLDSSGVSWLDAVFLTHAHQDAAGGFADLNHWLGRQGPREPLPVYTDSVTSQRLLAKHTNLKRLKFIAWPNYKIIKIGKLSVLPFLVEHAGQKNIETRGYKFGRDLAYASDVADIPLSSARKLLGLKTLVLDAAFYFKRKVLPSHFTTEEAIAWGFALGVHKLILTQTGHTYPPHAQAVQEIKEYLEERDIDTPEVILAFDGFGTEV